jgi:hypothetical protein
MTFLYYKLVITCLMLCLALDTDTVKHKKDTSIEINQEFSI